MTPEPIRHRSDPLSAWFLLLTTAAVLSTFLSGAFATEQDQAFAIGLSVILAVLFTLLGVCFRPRLRNAAVGFLCGGLMGGVCGILVGVETSSLTVQTFAVLAGSVMIVIVGLAGRSAR
jgi:hypothetical protein